MTNQDTHTLALSWAHLPCWTWCWLCSDRKQWTRQKTTDCQSYQTELEEDAKNVYSEMSYGQYIAFNLRRKISPLKEWTFPGNFV